MTELLILVLVCMCGEAFFSGMETGIISIHRMRLKHSSRQGARNAQILETFVNDFDRLLGTTLVGTNICIVITSVVTSSVAVRLIGPGGEAVSSPLVALLILVCCEYLPKAWFHARPLERCSRFAPLLRIAEIVFRPISYAIVGIARILTPGATRAYSRTDAFVTREDLKLLARETEKTGALTKRERVMIHRVFELSNKQARAVMVAREAIVAVPDNMPVEEFLTRARKSGFTRMPVTDRKTGQFIGIVNVFFVLSSGNGYANKTVRDYMRPVLYIPDSMPVDEILPRMRFARQPLCLVRDTAGTVLGLITTEDILSEIVGKLER
jgi:putative hemolysin